MGSDDSRAYPLTLKAESCIISLVHCLQSVAIHACISGEKYVKQLENLYECKLNPITCSLTATITTFSVVDPSSPNANPKNFTIGNLKKVWFMCQKVKDYPFYSMDDDKYLDLERRILQIEANLKEMFVQFKLIRNPDNLEQSSVKADFKHQ